MNAIEKLLPHLKMLRLSGILDTVEVRNQQAIEQKLSYLDFLALVLNDEFERRGNKKLHRRLRKANFQNDRTLESFRVDLPGMNVNKAPLFDIATCRFIEERVNVVIAGPTGVGKSHQAQAIGHQACRKGYDCSSDLSTRRWPNSRVPGAATANSVTLRPSHPRRLRTQAAGHTGG